MSQARPLRLPFMDVIPDVRDGLTRRQRVVLFVLSETQRELKGRSVPTAMLYGRVVEYIDMSERELVDIMRSLGVADHNR